MKIELDNVYPSYRAIDMATEEKIEEWFLTLPPFKTKREHIKWTVISSRYYHGPDPEGFYIG